MVRYFADRVNNHRKEHLKFLECVLAAFGTVTNVIIFMNRPRIGLCGPPHTDSRLHANGRRNVNAAPDWSATSQPTDTSTVRGK